MTNPAIDQVPVIIVGGGPTGLNLALQLGIRSVPCMLINEGETTPAHPQGSSHSARTMEHYRRLGVAEQVRATGLPPRQPTDSVYVTRIAGHEITRFRMPSSAEKTRPGSPDRRLTPEPMHRASQMYVEAVLKRRLETLAGVDLRFGWRLTGFTHHADHVVAELHHPASDTRRTVRCGYLVGCDGGLITVRRHLGINYEGEGGGEVGYMMGQMLSVYFEAPEFHSVALKKPAWQWQVFNAECRMSIMELDGSDKFLALSKIDPEIDTSDFDPRPLLRAAIGAEIPVTILSSKPWTAGLSLLAERYQDGRVLMAGDAVHLFTPSGGLGMNTGVDDAANLGWKLAAWYHGWAGDGLVESYEAERRPVAGRNLRQSFQLARASAEMLFPEHLEEASAAGGRDRAAIGARLSKVHPGLVASTGTELGARYDGSPLIVPDGTSPPPDHPLDYTPTACPGGRAPHVWLDDGTALFDHFGPEFTLLRLGGDRTADITGLQRAAATRNMPLTVVGIENEQARDIYGRDFALVRPDGHVAWRGDAIGDDPAGLLDRVVGQNSSRPKN